MGMLFGYDNWFIGIEINGLTSSNGHPEPFWLEKGAHMPQVLDGQSQNSLSKSNPMSKGDIVLMKK